MSGKPKPTLSSEEYLEIERSAEHKHEYFDGEMVAMAGGSPEHSQLIANVSAELVYQLKKHPCVVYSSDLRLNVAATGLYTYPDVTVVCGAPQFSDDQKDTLAPADSPHQRHPQSLVPSPLKRDLSNPVIVGIGNQQVTIGIDSYIGRIAETGFRRRASITSIGPHSPRPGLTRAGGGIDLADGGDHPH